MKFSIDELIKITQATVFYRQNNIEQFTVSTDTRKISKNDVYLPLIGEKYNGHDFIGQALEKGAYGFFTSDKSLKFSNAKLVLYVKDTLTAYLRLALYYKQRINPITIAITGSSGKTTTKEMLYCVTKEKFKTHKSLLNHNNEIGLAQTLLLQPPDTEILIVEMGMRGKGEIELLSKYSEPDISVITNVGPAHIGRLGSIENIAKAKCEITKHQSKEGCLIAHNDEYIKKNCLYEGQKSYIQLNDENFSINEMTRSCSEFIYNDNLYKLNIEGEYNIKNAILVIEAGLKLGMSPEKIAAGLEKYKPIEKRWQVEEHKGLTIINDSYNANPDSVKSALDTFLKFYPNPKIVVLGAMAELGGHEEAYHKEIGEFLNNYEFDLLITVGKSAGITAQSSRAKSVELENNEAVVNYIKENVSGSASLLLKASRSLEFEQILEGLK